MLFFVSAVPEENLLAPDEPDMVSVFYFRERSG